MNALINKNYEKLKIKYFKELYNMEALHSNIYKALANEKKLKSNNLYHDLKVILTKDELNLLLYLLEEEGLNKLRFNFKFEEKKVSE